MINLEEVTKEELWEFIDLLCKDVKRELERLDKYDKKIKEYAKSDFEAMQNDKYGFCNGHLQSIQSLCRDARENSLYHSKLFFSTINEFSRYRELNGDTESFKFFLYNLRNEVLNCEFIDKI